MHPDNQLIRKIKKRQDRNAADELISRYYREVYAFAYKQTGDQELAMDLTQEIFISVVKGLGHFDERKASAAYLDRKAELYTETEMSLLPYSAMDWLFRDYPNMAILMMFCCIIVILPTQIGERISMMKGLQCSTYCGRRIEKVQLQAAMTVSLVLCLIQTGIYFIALWKAGMLDYVKCPANITFGDYALWFDMNWGTYLILYSILMIVFVLAAVSIFFVSCKRASNYITGIAFALVPAILFSALCINVLDNFLQLNGFKATVYAPTGLVLGMILVGAVLNAAIYRWSLKKDVIE